MGGTHSFELRLWDARIGRWMSPDPKGQYASPYLGMGNAPVMRIDPDGGEDNPVVDAVTGEMIGTTESGMEGDIIVMKSEDFTQGMSDDEALTKGRFLSQSNFKDWQKFLIQRQIDKRPDRDGIVTEREADAWGKAGNTGNLYVDFAKLDFKDSYLNVQDFKSGNVQLVNFLSGGNLHLFKPNVLYRPVGTNNPLSFVHGTIYIKLINPEIGEVAPTSYTKKFDTYDFRFFERLIKGKMSEFDFIGYGTGHIRLEPRKNPDKFPSKKYQ